MLTVILGVIVGLAAGYFGGFVDTVLARLIDVVLSMPFLLVADRAGLGLRARAC